MYILYTVLLKPLQQVPVLFQNAFLLLGLADWKLILDEIRVGRKVFAQPVNVARVCGEQTGAFWRLVMRLVDRRLPLGRVE